MQRRARTAVIGLACLAAAVVLASALRPVLVEGRACRAERGAVGWVLGGGAAARDQAAADAEQMRPVVADAALGSTPMGREALDDARDQLRDDETVLATADACDAAARTQLAVAVGGAVVAAAAVVALAWLGRWLVGRWRARAVADRPPDRVDPGTCPQCGAQLDDDLGCWRCDAYRDGDRWLAPTAAPPTTARRVEPPRAR